VRNQLAEFYMPLAYAVAARRSGSPRARDDLNQAAMLGLLSALDRFDPERGVEFTTFAWATINGALKMHSRDSGWGMRVSRSMQELCMKVGRAVDELTVQLGRSPTVIEVARRCGVPEEDVVQAQEVRSAYLPASLDASARDEGPSQVVLPVADGRLAAVEHRALLSPLVARLPERDQRILNLRFVDQLSQSEIAARVGSNQMSVSRSLTRSLALLRQWLDEEDEEKIPEPPTRRPKPLATPRHAPRAQSWASAGGSSARLPATTTASSPRPD